MCDFKSFEKPKKKLEIQYVISKSFENQRKSWGMTFFLQKGREYPG